MSPTLPRSICFPASASEGSLSLVSRGSGISVNYMRRHRLGSLLGSAILHPGARTRIAWAILAYNLDILALRPA
jgi:hypothetical protein